MHHEYNKMNPLLLTIFTKSVFRTQLRRSHNSCRMEKDDIFDSKNSFMNQIRTIITEENEATDTTEQLVLSVCERVRIWIQNEKPSAITDFSWRFY